MTKKIKPAPFKFKGFSRKQKQVLTWWTDASSVKDKDGIICDGSVRSGKTIIMSLSYVMWAMHCFNDENLGLSGKTIGSLRRNVVAPLKRMLDSRGYEVKDRRADNLLVISKRGRTNYFYLFGGKDESSQDLIQGITLAGMLFDEVALMPQSFVNQAMARCSVDGAKFWFNCNPESPYHWFKEEILDKHKEQNLIHLHFTMNDNPSLSRRVKERYKRMFSGVFYKRMILGLWVMAEGIIYDLFDEKKHCTEDVPTTFDYYLVGVDYGTGNPTVFGLYGVKGKNIFKVDEYYYDSKKHNRQKTDQEYSQDMKEFLGDVVPRFIYLDPSAASFKAQLRKDGFNQVKDADNAVVDGIRTQSTMLQSGRYKIVKSKCPQTVRDYAAYVWDPKAQARGEDKPIKENDHTKDEERYVLHTHFGRPPRKAKAVQSLY